MEIKQGSYSNPSDPRFFKHFDFETDLEIPVVLVFVVRKLKKNPEPELLVMRRAPKGLGAMQGLWSPIAGVDDHTAGSHNDSEWRATVATIEDELEEEAGIKFYDNLFRICNNDHKDRNSKVEGRVWQQQLFFVRADVDKVVLNWENIGALWFPFSEIEAWVQRDFKPVYSNLLSKESTTFANDGNLERFWDWMKRNPITE